MLDLDEKCRTEWREVARGVPSRRCLDSLTDEHVLSTAKSMGIDDFEREFRTTWFLRFEDALEDASWVAWEGERKYVEVGDVHVADMQDVNEREGFVTIEDGLVDVRDLIPITP